MKKRVILASALFEAIRNANACLDSLMEPTLDNLNYVAAVKDIVFDRFKCSDNRNIFVMACVLLYCPRVLLGERASSGLMASVARELGTSANAISHVRASVLDRYGIERSFAANVDFVCDLVRKSFQSQRNV